MNGILNIISVYSVAYFGCIHIILAVYAGPSQLFQESDAMSQVYIHSMIGAIRSSGRGKACDSALRYRDTRSATRIC
jgi:hypothetical protein